MSKCFNENLKFVKSQNQIVIQECFDEFFYWNDRRNFRASIFGVHRQWAELAA